MAENSDSVRCIGQAIFSVNGERHKGQKFPFEQAYLNSSNAAIAQTRILVQIGRGGGVEGFF